MTPLMCAVKVLGPKDGDDKIVTYLLENKANMNTQVKSFPCLLSDIVFYMKTYS